MKKFIPIVIVGIVVLSGLGAAAFSTNLSMKKTTVQKSESASILFSSRPTLVEKDGFVKIEINGATTHSIDPNKPVLPIFVKTYRLPWGSKNIQITCTLKDISTMQLTKQIMPARVAPLSKPEELKTIVPDESVYSSSAYYPDTWYTTDLGAGRDYNDQEVIFAKIICYPVRYSPATNIVEYANGFDVTMTYDEPIAPQKTLDTTDMVIIAPAAFEAKIQPLIDHKNAKGVSTIFKSVEDILSQYDGTDPPEQIKFYIKEMYDTLGIKYVLLFGGLKSHINAKDKDARSYGSTAWHVPVRYVSIPQDDDEGCLSDLYYGCLYNGTGAFDSWDSNGDGVYAAWGAGLGIPNDKFDMYPEVYVSRLPCTTTNEVSVVVKKIIKYESTGPDAKPWYKNFVGVGGKTFDYYEGKPDGEYLCDLAADYMSNAIPDLVPVKCYSSNRDTGGLTPVPKDITKSITKGAGYVDFEGHGNPFAWNTIWFDGVYPENWTGGVNVYLFPFISNRNKLPVVVVGGCHNALYNITILGTLKDQAGTQYFCYGVPIPVCFSWGLVVKPRGGAIASTGCTGYGMGYEGNPVTLSGELESNFFWQIGMNGTTNLAAAHSRAIQKFLAEEEINLIEAFCITNWALLGDPSLQFGGYSS
jgi:hypothetical protein